MNIAMSDWTSLVGMLERDPALAPYWRNAAAFVWSTDGRSVLWADKRGEALQADLGPGFGERARERLRLMGQGLAPLTGVRLERLALSRDAGIPSVTCACRRVRLTSGQDGLLVLAQTAGLDVILDRSRLAAPAAAKAQPAPAPAPSAPALSARPAQPLAQPPASIGAPPVAAPAMAAPTAPAVSATANPPQPVPQMPIEDAGIDTEDLGVDTSDVDEPAIEERANKQPADDESLAEEPAQGPPVIAENDASAVDAEAASALAMLASTPAPVPAVPASTMPGQVFAKKLRFVWRTDADQRFVELSPDFLAMLELADPGMLLGRSRDEVARERIRDQNGAFFAGLERRETFRDAPVLFRIGETNGAVSAALSGAPIWSATEGFEGFRGFGVLKPLSQTQAQPQPAPGPAASGAIGDDNAALPAEAALPALAKAGQALADQALSGDASADDGDLAPATTADADAAIAAAGDDEAEDEAEDKAEISEAEAAASAMDEVGLDDVSLEDAEPEDVDLDDAELDDADLEDADLEDTSLDATDQDDIDLPAVAPDGVSQVAEPPKRPALAFPSLPARPTGLAGLSRAEKTPAAVPGPPGAAQVQGPAPKGLAALFPKQEPKPVSAPVVTEPAVAVSPLSAQPQAEQETGADEGGTNAPVPPAQPQPKGLAALFPDQALRAKRRDVAENATSEMPPAPQETADLAEDAGLADEAEDADQIAMTDEPDRAGDIEPAEEAGLSHEAETDAPADQADDVSDAKADAADAAGDREGQASAAPAPRLPPVATLQSQLPQMLRAGGATGGQQAAASAPAIRPQLQPAKADLSPAERQAFRQIAEALGADIAAPGEGTGEGTGESAGETGATPPPAPILPAAVPPRDAARRVSAPLDAHAELMDKLPIGVLVSRNGEAIYANRTLLDLVGYGDVADIAAHGGMGSLFRGHAPDEGGGAVLLVGKDGGLETVEARLSAIAWQGKPATLMSFRRAIEADAPARARALELDVDAGKARLAELSAILDTATDGVITLDARGRILSLNSAAEALFGYDQREVIGEIVTMLFAPESHAPAMDYLDGLKGGGVASVLNDGREVVGMVRQGGRVPLFMTMGRIAEGKEAKFCAVLRDITAWKKAESELTEARKAAERASAQKSDVLAKISHEIRTPLNAIIGFSEVMAEERFGPLGSERYKEYARDIRESGGYLISLVNDLLDLAKIEAGRLDLDFESVSLNEIASSAVSLLQPEAARNRVVLRTGLSAKLPPVVADERSLRQIIINLLSNAVKFTDSGGQVIVSTALGDKGEAILRVRDTGIGMTADQLKLALEPFRQVSATRRGGGTGLGLPLTKALVEANRGAFQITSVPNEGTLAEVIFPPQRVLAG